MKPIFTISLLLIAHLLVSQEPVWIQFEENYPYHITTCSIDIDQFNSVYSVSEWFHPSSYERVSQIAKFSPEGNILWNCNLQADSTSIRGVYISHTGTSYITKTITMSYLDQYSLLIAIDDVGNEIFSHKSNDVNFNDVISDNDGNVYVTGHSFETSCENKAVIAKFDSGGDLLWQTCWDEPCQYSSGKRLLVDNNSHLFVIGNFNTNQYISLYIAKYNLDGYLLDYKLFTTNPWYLKNIHQVAIDMDDNIYITGRYEDEAWWYQGFIYKFDSLLSEMWHDTTSLSYYLFTDMAIDSDKNLVLSGYENQNISDQPHATYAKYDQEGNKLWHFTNDSIKSRINSIALFNNHYFLTGRLWNEDKYNYEYITMRLNTDGEIINSHLIESVDTTYNVGVDNIIDHDGNLICTGIYEDTTKYCLTMKYDALTFKEEVISKKKDFFKVYPNPAKTIVNININLKNQETIELKLFNINGELQQYKVLKNLREGLNTVNLDIQGIPSGLHILQCQINSEVFSRKILISK